MIKKLRQFSNQSSPLMSKFFFIKFSYFFFTTICLSLILHKIFENIYEGLIQIQTLFCPSCILWKTKIQGHRPGIFCSLKKEWNHWIKN